MAVSAAAVRARARPGEEKIILFVFRRMLAMAGEIMDVWTTVVIQQGAQTERGQDLPLALA